MKYRITTFLTLSGKRELILLGMQSYGEWIIYENDLPKYHVDCFRKDSESDLIIKELLESRNWTIEGILDRINKEERVKLSFGKNRPLIEIVLFSELRELELDSLPIDWVEKIKTAGNNSQKANASDSVNLKRNASNKR